MSNRHATKITRIFRSTRLAIHTLYGFFIAGVILPRVNTRRRKWWISRWCKQLLAILNIRVIVHGTLPGEDVTGTMFVANHVSWTDIHALNSVHAVRFVAKSEIRGWPVFGWFAEKVDTLFTERTRRQDAGRMVEITANSLRAGDCLCFFPEGTTSDGTQILPFKGSLMQAAINAEAKIWPVSIRYTNTDGSPNIEMAYFGEMSLLESMQQVIAQHSPVVELHFAAPIPAKGYERRDLSILAKHTIAKRLNLHEQSS
ncbi:MAG TPA: lysophospholipid acyltransferase family protein [Methylophilaceae bacterium]